MTKEEFLSVLHVIGVRRYFTDAFTHTYWWNDRFIGAFNIHTSLSYEDMLQHIRRQVKKIKNDISQ